MYHHSSLHRFEYSTLKKLLKIDSATDTSATILLNLQVSGGMDSMCLLHALSNVINSRLFCSKNKFIPIVQHFNHKMRGEESDGDAEFVRDTCLNMGIPYFQNDFLHYNAAENFQNAARKLRKEAAVTLSLSLKKELSYTKYYIVTAHHGRDHVETILQHILRGCSLYGLRGLQEFDEEGIYFRPFYDVEYETLTRYFHEKNIACRVDSSNLRDNYERNYIRQHIIPHFKKLNATYEQSFRKLSQHVCEQKEFFLQSHSTNKEFLITLHTRPVQLLKFLREDRLQRSPEENDSITRNVIHNILHEAKLMLSNKVASKEIKLKSKWMIKLINQSNIDISCSLEERAH